jgi:hypothetical protein
MSEADKGPYGQCAACEALYNNAYAREPHAHLDLGWTDPVNLSMSVYICRDCRSLCVQDLSDPVQCWK